MKKAVITPKNHNGGGKGGERKEVKARILTGELN